MLLSVGPICLELNVPRASEYERNSTISLYVYLHWNQDQGPSLYGFSSELEKRLFLLITSCAGIGPKIAVAALADLGPQSLVGAIQTADERALSKVSGIGLKKAEQIIVQLRRKIEPVIESSGQELAGIGTSIAHWSSLREALTSLGYSRMEITRAITSLQGTDGMSQAPFDVLMRNALSFLSKQS